MSSDRNAAPCKPALGSGLLPYLDRERIFDRFQLAPGAEIDSGKFESLESSAALVANAFGFFLDRPHDLPALPGVVLRGAPMEISLERCLHFPWKGGLHPWLDVVIETDCELIGIESKRFEPFRTRKGPEFSDAYLRPVWGAYMERYKRLRDRIIADEAGFSMLDAAQLVKHALGVRTQAAKRGKQPLLIYLHAEPVTWPDGRPIDVAAIKTHRKEAEEFGSFVAGDEVAFYRIDYQTLLTGWSRSSVSDIAEHASAVASAFSPL